MSQLSPAARAAALLALVVWISPSLADPGWVDEGGEIHQPPLIASEAMEVAPAAPRVDAPGEIHAATPTRPASPEVVELAPEVPPLADGSKPTGITTVPVTGAFGLRLGEPFDPDQVAMVLGERPQTYRGPEGAERAGTRYQVEPLQPSPCFQTYLVNTTQDGRIYAIRADYEDLGRASVCPETKAIAAELEAKYGRPRGKAAFGEWYAFRESLDPLTRHLTFYANRCRRGAYGIAYTDDRTQLTPQPPSDP